METSFAYRVLIKTIEGKIPEDKAERILKKYFDLRYNNLCNECDVFPKRSRRILKLIGIYGMNCVFCGIRMCRTENSNCHPENQVTIEHILPRLKGGIGHIDNCCLSCAKCNSHKMSEIVPMHIKIKLFNNNNKKRNKLNSIFNICKIPKELLG